MLPSLPSGYSLKLLTGHFRTDRLFLWSDTYTQADIFLVNLINYAKSIGKSVGDIASFTGDQIKTGWNEADGYICFEKITDYLGTIY